MLAFEVRCLFRFGVTRERFYDRVRAADYELAIYVLDAPRSIRRERVQRRNREKGRTFSMEVPIDIFELASDLWQPLEHDECSGRNVHFVGAKS